MSCSRCHRPLDTIGRYCRACRAAYMREWRATHITISRDDYDANDDFAKSIDEAYRVIRERKAQGGKGWP
jgi:RNA polymerase subunit RPABC4/transcription elongation factor Spt4